MKKCSRLVQEKAVWKEENLKARRKKREKNTIETETTLSWKVAFLNFFLVQRSSAFLLWGK